MRGIKQYRETVFFITTVIAIVAGIIGAIAAYSVTVDDPIPEMPSLFEEIDILQRDWSGECLYFLFLLSPFHDNIIQHCCFFENSDQELNDPCDDV